jgi:hypothetical protein
VHQYFPVLAGQALQSDSGNIAAVQAVQQALVENPRLAACYTYGYNVSLFAQRAQQLGQTILWLSQEHPGATIAVSGSDAEAALAAAGVFVAQYLTTAKPASLPTLQLKLAPNAYTFATVASIRDPNFVPGAARFWDLPGLIACLNAPVELVATRPQDYQRVAGLVELAGGSLTVALGN